MGKCSEMDIPLEMWIHAIYNDPSVQGSYSGSVVYYRNHTGNPVTSFQTLGQRWSQSKIRYILSPLSLACKNTVNIYTLNIICPYGKAAYRFELTIKPDEEGKLRKKLILEMNAEKVDGNVGESAEGDEWDEGCEK